MSDRKIRKMALRTIPHQPLKTKQDYLQRVKAANALWVKEHSKFWMQYLRNKEGRPCGLVILYEIADQAYVTGSYCNPRDRWNKDMAFFYATRRESTPWISAKGEIIGDLPPSCRVLAEALARRILKI